MGNQDKAKRDFDEARRLKCQAALGFTMRGDSRFELDELVQYKRAIDDFEEASNLETLFVEAYVGRALAHTDLGDDAEAQQNVERAVELGYDRASLRQAVDTLNKRRKTPRGGYPTVMRQLATGPPPIHWLILMPQKRLTDWEREELERFLQANPLLAEADALKERFLSVISCKDVFAFDLWLSDASESGPSTYRRLASNNRQDYDAVGLGLALTIP